MRQLPLLVALALTLGGCSTVRFCDVGGQTTVDVTNTGWYLLNVIPVVSGDPDAPNAFGCRLFSDTVSLANNVRMLETAVKRRVQGADAASLRFGKVVSYLSDETVLPLVLKLHACHTSAIIVAPRPSLDPPGDVPAASADGGAPTSE